MAGFAREHDGHRLDVDHGLAAERAADLRRIDAQVAELHAEQLRGVGADDEVPLARAPELALPVGVAAGHATLRLDIGLMHGRGLERHLDDLVGCRKTGREIAQLEFDPLGNIGGLRRRLDPAGDQVGKQERRIRLHRLVDIDDMRQHFVVDRDQRQRLVGDRLAGRRHRGHGMALIERLLARHDIARHMPEILRDTFRANILELLLWEVRGGHHGLDAGQRGRLRGIDRANARMGVGRAQDAADQHTRHRQVRAVLREPRHLRHAVRTNRPGPNPLELLYRFARSDVVHS